MCLAILRHVGNLTTDGVVTEAKRLGIDWGDVAGGPGNAVHGALWRERQKGTVRKARNGPWELIRPEAAPILDLKRGVALFSGDSLHPNQAVEKRREVVRGLIESGMHSPQEILDQLRSTPGFENTQRSMIRDDLDSLIANGRVEKSGYGVYTAR